MIFKQVHKKKVMGFLAYVIVNYTELDSLGNPKEKVEYRLSPEGPLTVRSRSAVTSSKNGADRNAPLGAFLMVFFALCE